jgi:hypothetical protein
MDTHDVDGDDFTHFHVSGGTIRGRKREKRRTEQTYEKGSRKRRFLGLSGQPRRGAEMKDWALTECFMKRARQQPRSYERLHEQGQRKERKAQGRGADYNRPETYLGFL